MSERERDERLGLMAEELAEALAAGEAIDPAHWATRFEVDGSDVTACVRALRAFDSCLGEEPADGRPELPLPTLPESFRIEGELGRGGMGVVYRATQPALGRTVAVKVLRPGELQFGEALRRFRDEARSLARLRHRHIVSIHEVGETAEGLLWYAMDLVEGRTLADEIDAAGALTPSRAVRVMSQVTSAIAHAHAQGIVHRDLKPQNVLIDAAGDAYVVDFGLARDASTAGTRTMTGELLGTPAYMSPEQAAGEHARIGEPTDVWALGALLYESLTGRGPFDGKPLHGTIRAILEEEPKSPRKVDPRVPAELEAVAMKALRKKPEQRYPTALAFGEELERFADGRGVRARNPNLLERAGRFTWRHRSTVGIATMVALVLVLLFGVFVVPEELRASRIADARRSFEGGYAGAAVAPLRDVAEGLAEDDPIWRDFDLLLLKALNARCAELLADGQLDAARELFVAGREIALRRWRAGRPTDVLHVDLGERPDWEYELLVLRELAKHPAWPQDWFEGHVGFEGGVLGFGFHREQFARDWSHPGRGRRLLAEDVAWGVLGNPDLAKIDPQLRVDVFVRMQRRLAGWIDAATGDAGERPLILSMGWSVEQLRDWWSPGLEDALAALAEDPAEDAVLRGLALRTLSRFTGLPCYPHLRAAEPDVAGFLRRRAEAAPGVVARWRSWRGMSREAALRDRIEAMVEGLDGRTFGYPEAAPFGVLRTVGTWLGGRSPASRGDAMGLRSWWQERRQRPVEDWVREALGVPAGREIGYAEALSSASVASAEEAFLWRHLAWLRLPESLRVPEIVHSSNSSKVARAWLPAWRAAGGMAVERDYIVRMGVLMFRDVGAAPELIGEVEQEISAGEPVELNWRRSIPVDFGPRIDWRSYGDDAREARHFRQHPDVVLAPREVRAHLRCELLAGGEEPYLNVETKQLVARVPVLGGVRAGRSGGGPIRIGEARCVDSDTHYGGGLERSLVFMLLVRVDPVGAQPETGRLAAWREGFVRMLDNRAAEVRARAATRRPMSAGESGSAVGGLVGVLTHFDFGLPARWPMPEAAAAMQVLAPGRPFEALAALWNAGVGDPEQPIVGGGTDAHSALEWGSVALLAPKPELRQRARGLLSEAMDVKTWGNGLSPAGARLLLEQRADELEPELAAKLRARAAAFSSPWFAGRLVAGVLLILALCAGLALAFSQHRLGGRAAWVAWVAAAVSTFFRLETDGFVGPPLYLFLLAAALAGVRVPSIDGNRGPRVLAAALPLGLALWAFAAVEGYTLPPPEGAFWLMLLPPFLCIRATLRPRRRVRRRDPGHLVRLGA